MTVEYAGSSRKWLTKTNSHLLCGTGFATVDGLSVVVVVFYSLVICWMLLTVAKDESDEKTNTPNPKYFLETLPK